MRKLLFLCLFLTGCSGTFSLTPNHKFLYQSHDKEFSCLAARCCYPYQEKVMICAEPSINNTLFTINIVPENKGK